MDLVLLENTSITLKELDNMDIKRKLRFYFYLVEKNKAEAKALSGKEVIKFE